MIKIFYAGWLSSMQDAGANRDTCWVLVRYTVPWSHARPTTLFQRQICKLIHTKTKRAASPSYVSNSLTFHWQGPACGWRCVKASTTNGLGFAEGLLYQSWLSYRFGVNPKNKSAPKMGHPTPWTAPWHFYVEWPSSMQDAGANTLRHCSLVTRPTQQHYFKDR